MATGVQVWSITPTNNATSDSNINFAEGMAPSQVNDSCRAMMSSVARWNNDNNGTLVTSGSSAALTVTTNQVESGLTSGYTVAAILGTAVAGGASLAVDGLTPQPIYTSLSTASAVSTGLLSQNQFCAFIYSTAVSGWVITGNSPSASVSSTAPVGTSFSQSLSADLALTANTTVASGLSLAQGSTGTWYASGTLTFLGTAGASSVYAKLWDGTTVIDSASGGTPSAGFGCSVTVGGVLTNPSSNIQVTVYTASNGVSVKFNSSGYSKDSTLTAYRIA